MYPWTFEATDLFGNSLGEVVNPDARRVASGIKRPSTANFTINVENPIFKRIRALDYAVLIKAYYGAQLRFHGNLTNYQRVSESGKRTVMFTASDPYAFRFPKRFLNMTPNIVPYGPENRGALVRDFLDAVHDQYGLGVRTGVQPFSAGDEVTYNLSPFKPLNEFVAELSAGDAGFEWRILPIEYENGYQGDWIAANRLGVARPNAIFEHNYGANNVTRAEELGDLTTMMNMAMHIAETGPGAPGAPVVTGTNTGSIQKFGYQQNLVSAQITDLDMRQALVDDAVQIAGDWRRVFSFQPAVYDADHPGRVPQLGQDYDVGDTVRARASDNPNDPDAMWFDGWARVWAVEDAPDRTGKITRTLTLIEDTSA